MNRPDSVPLPAVFNLHGIAPVPHLSILRAQGKDAAQFLHSQLTQDFSLLDMQHARLAAFCSAKGRMQASLVGFMHAPDDVLLIISRDLLAQTLKRLSMFVLRAQCRLTEASTDFQLLGLVGDVVPGGVQPPWTLQTTDTANRAHIIHLYPVATTARALWLAPVGVNAPQGPALDTTAWLWGEVMSGIATVSQPVYEQFVPQMLNYESVGGVNFKKGCYPGQEVVARSQFRGTLKRRAYIVHASSAIQAGDEVFAASDAEQPVGLVVQAAPHPITGQWAAIISMQTSAATQALTVGGTHGAVLTIQPLPYALLEDI